MPIVIDVSDTTPIVLEIDSTSVDAGNTPYDVIAAGSRILMAEEYPWPEVETTYASSPETEGSELAHQKHQNRTGCQATIRVVSPDAATLEAEISAFSQKVDKVRREGGTLRRVTPAGSAYVLELLPGSLAVPFNRRYLKVNVAEVTWRFDAKPYWTGPAVTQADHTETTLPALVWTES